MDWPWPWSDRISRRVFDRLTPDVQYNVSGTTRSSEDTRRLIQGILSQTKFENLVIAHLKTNAGGEARRGQAEFQVFCRGTHGSMPFAAAETAWSLGLRETSPGVWKVNRITPVSLPSHQNVLPTTFLYPDWLLEPAPVVRHSPPARISRRSACWRNFRSRPRPRRRCSPDQSATKPQRGT